MKEPNITVIVTQLIAEIDESAEKYIERIREKLESDCPEFSEHRQALLENLSIAYKSGMQHGIRQIAEKLSKACQQD